MANIYFKNQNPAVDAAEAAHMDAIDAAIQTYKTAVQGLTTQSAVNAATATLNASLDVAHLKRHNTLKSLGAL